MNNLDNFKSPDMVYGYLIDGKWSYSQSGRTLDVISPLDNSVVGKVQALTKEEISNVFQNSKNAFNNWHNLEAYKRAMFMHKAADIILENIELLTDLLMYEIGKNRADSYNEVQRTVDLINFFAEEGTRLKGDVLKSDSFPNVGKNKVAISQLEPLGVVLAIPPFNYPINEGAPKIVAALITGNTVVYKPSLNGSISGLFMAEAFRLAGLPAGVLNVVTGNTSEIGDYLVSHDLIDAINFTGSYETAQRIRKVMNPVKFIAGLSGKDAAVVLDDTNLNFAAKEIFEGAFSFSGQRCTAIKRVIVLNNVANELISQLSNLVSNSKLGDVREGGVTHGPVINEKSAQYVQELIEDAKSKGANVIIGGGRNGTYVDLTLLDNINENMRIAWEEPFGPVLPIIRVNTLEEAIEMSNKSEYGLQGSVFTNDINKAMYISSKLEVGTANINGKDSRGPDNFPFIGIKHSGLGYLGGAEYLIKETTYLKTTVINLS